MRLERKKDKKERMMIEREKKEKREIQTKTDIEKNSS